MALLRLSLTISLVCMVKKPSSPNQTYPVTPGGTEQTEVETSTLRGSSGLADDLQTTEAYVTRGTHSQQFEASNWKEEIGLIGGGNRLNGTMDTSVMEGRS